MKFVQGDICQTELEDIIHGCNAQGKMNSGVAKAIREAFPGCYETYVTQLQEQVGNKTSSLLGYDAIHFVKGTLSGPKRIHNLVTQDFYGHDGKKYATYFHTIRGITKIIANNPSSYGRTRDVFAIPRIGCSLGGLKWEIMEELLKEVEDATGAEFWVYSI